MCIAGGGPTGALTAEPLQRMMQGLTLPSLPGGPSAPTAPLIEPLKDATGRIEAARADAARAQLLRKGLMSTFTRYPNGGMGKARKLGG